ncbi:MAG: hypothetical protein ACI9FD_003487 [Gammaproteobacteria bacterium]|jgi:hypothetical protein
MKKAHLTLTDIDGIDEQPISNRLIELDDDATNDDLQDVIDEIEQETKMVCHDWEWCTDKKAAAHG